MALPVGVVETENLATPNKVRPFPEVDSCLLLSGITQIFWMCEGDGDRVLTSQSRFFLTGEANQTIRLAIAKIHCRSIPRKQRGLASTLLSTEHVNLGGYFCATPRHNHLANGITGTALMVA